MKLTEIKAALIAKIQGAYPPSEYNYYSSAVIENYERPCFFTDLSIDPSEAASRSVRHNEGLFEVEFLQESVDEYKALEVADTIRDLFGYAVRVGDRYVKVLECAVDYEGTDDNIVVLTFRLDWHDYVRPAETAELMRNVETNIETTIEGG